MELVTVYTVKNPNRAEVLRIALENEGIPCRIDGEGQAGLAGVFDIGLLVWEADYARARQLIESFEKQERPHGFSDAIDDNSEDEAGGAQ